MNTYTFESFDPKEVYITILEEDPDVWESYVKTNIEDLSKIYGVRYYKLKDKKGHNNGKID